MRIHNEYIFLKLHTIPQYENIEMLESSVTYLNVRHLNKTFLVLKMFAP